MAPADSLSSDRRPITRAEADLLFEVVKQTNLAAQARFVEAGVNVPKNLKGAMDVVIDIRDRFDR